MKKIIMLIAVSLLMVSPAFADRDGWPLYGGKPAPVYNKENPPEIKPDQTKIRYDSQGQYDGYSIEKNNGSRINYDRDGKYDGFEPAD